MPHPPIVVPAVGRGREREAGATCDAMTALARRLVAKNPDRLVLISPHSPRRRGMFGVWAEERHRGHLGAFGARGEVIEGARRIDGAVHSHPWQALAVTAVVSFLAGLLVRRR